MKRNIIDELIKWKTEDNGKVILLTGLKGVGKTYLAYDFAKSFFDSISYINLEHERDFLNLFNCISPSLLKERLINYLRLNENVPHNLRILILDEISDCTNAVEKLLACNVSDIFRYIILISSKPVVIKSENIRQLAVYPLSFDEFLIASGNDWYIDTIVTHFNMDKKIPEIVHKELLELNQLYLRIGGMPGVINEYLNLCSTINVSEIHKLFTSMYRDNISRIATESEAFKMLQVYDSLAVQLAKENKKFQYKLIRKGTTHAMYKDAIQKLCDDYYVIRCSRVSNQQVQNISNTFTTNDWQSIESNTHFKLYLPDTGVLYTQIQSTFGQSLNRHQYKAILENYVAASLAAKNYRFAFWESESMSKIDFIYLKDDLILPVEIFDGDNTRSKNISVLRQKCNFPYAIKISSRNFEFRNETKFVPYYAVFCL